MDHVNLMKLTQSEFLLSPTTVAPQLPLSVPFPAGRSRELFSPPPHPL